MALRIESAGRTDVGLVREKNEDAMLIDPSIGLYVVCDGMGGHVGGQVASQLAVATIAETLRNQAPLGPGDEDILQTSIQRANQAVFNKAKADPNLHNMGTTVVGIRADGDLVHLVHGGDSRIYRLDQKSTRLNSSHQCISYAVF